MFRLFRNLSTRSKGIMVSDNAWKKMNTIYNSTNYNTFLFAANSGGCGGLNYYFKNVNPMTILEMDKGHKLPLTKIKNDILEVYVEPLSEMYLLGTTIDYISEDYNKNIYESKFVFIRDKDIVNTCGCGESFYINDHMI